MCSSSSFNQPRGLTLGLGSMKVTANHQVRKRTLEPPSTKLGEARTQFTRMAANSISRELHGLAMDEGGEFFRRGGRRFHDVRPVRTLEPKAAHRGAARDRAVRHR